MVRSEIRLITAVLIAIMFLIAWIASHSAMAANEEDIATIIAQELELGQEQTNQLRTAVKKYGDQPEALMEEQEAEDADPAKMIDGIQQARDAHNKEVEK